jgi:hypothetical protein
MRRFAYMLAFASMLLFAAGGIAHAQDPDRVEVKVPFSFYAGTTLLPAGTYFLTEHPAEESVLEIDASNGQGKAYLITESVQANRASSDSRAVFDEIGGKYFLAELWTQGENSGYSFPKTSMETALENQALHSQRHVIQAHKSMEKKEKK